MERWFTIVIIKPDAYAHRKLILQDIGRHGLFVQNARDIEFTPETCASFYFELVDDPQYPNFETFMCSGRSLVLKVAARRNDINPISHWRNLMGPTDPEQARAESDQYLRGIYGTQYPHNALHGSDSWESAICEMAVLKL